MFLVEFVVSLMQSDTMVITNAIKAQELADVLIFA